jgi:DNA-binding NarL/FixJ family response regulator
MGMDRHVSRIPVLLVAAANAFREGASSAGRVSSLHDGQDELRVISLPRPDSALSCKLSPAECSVVGLLMAGHTHAEIGEVRNRSARTIANQLAAAFNKLGVSGRVELLRYALENPADPAQAYAGGESSRRRSRVRNALESLNAGAQVGVM